MGFFCFIIMRNQSCPFAVNSTPAPVFILIMDSVPQNNQASSLFVYNLWFLGFFDYWSPNIVSQSRQDRLYATFLFTTLHLFSSNGLHSHSAARVMRSIYHWFVLPGKNNAPRIRKRPLLPSLRYYSISLMDGKSARSVIDLRVREEWLAFPASYNIACICVDWYWLTLIPASWDWWFKCWKRRGR